jgi:hypothetical protein
MILAASFEFDRRNNPEVVDRESDNIEIPQVISFILPIKLLNFSNNFVLY